MGPAITRRHLLLGAAVLAMPAAAAHAAADAFDAVRLVRKVYEDSLQADRQKTGMSEEKFLAPLALSLRTLWQVARGNRSPKAPIGPKVHALYGTGVLPGHVVTLDDLVLEGASASQATVAIALTVRGAPRRVHVDLVQEDGSWRIANFRYPDDDYVSFLKRTMAP